jgi:hypothetical protein
MRTHPGANQDRQSFHRSHVVIAVTLNFIAVNGPDGWVISDVESPHDSLRMFLAQYKN